MAQKLTRDERIALGEKRIVSVLKAHKVALGRTIEQKIADAGPFGQRINPHLITAARKRLEEAGRIVRIKGSNGDWYHLPDTRPADIRKRKEAQEPIHLRTCEPAFTKRVGQALEIAVYRAIVEIPQLEGMGCFTDLDTHNDATLYSKEEPPSRIGPHAISGKRKLDFIVRHPNAGWAGIEVKNVRDWIYPHDDMIKDLLAKSVELDVVPVLIARRVPFVTFRTFHHAGILIHETYNQLYPEADRALAIKASDKSLLGLHDIRVGNEPDERMLKFIQKDLSGLIPNARAKFERHKDIIGIFAANGITLKDFIAEMRARSSADADIEDDGDW